MEKNKLLYKYDFTIPEEAITKENLISFLNDEANKWAFQLERASSGYVHWQGRLSFKKKKRLSTVLKEYKECKKIHWSVTSNNGIAKNKFSYVMKVDTRIDGPWSDKDIPKYIPRQYRNKIEQLRPFQKHIWDTRNEFNDRVINLIYNKKGNIGKTVIAALCELYGDGIDLPPINKGPELIAAMCDICKGKELRSPSPIFFDLPRAMDKDKLGGIYVAIEQIKKGKLVDLRYKYQDWWIDSPVVWVFTNEEPNLYHMSMDRWKIWEVNERYELEKFDIKKLLIDNEELI